MLAQHAQVLAQPHLTNFLATLQTLEANSTEQDAKDNVLAAVTKILHYQYMPLPAAQRPPEFASMLSHVMSSMPLTGDDSENETVLTLAFELFKSDKETFAKY